MLSDGLRHHSFVIIFFSSHTRTLIFYEEYSYTAKEGRFAGVQIVIPLKDDSMVVTIDFKDMTQYENFAELCVQAVADTIRIATDRCKITLGHSICQRVIY